MVVPRQERHSPVGWICSEVGTGLPMSDPERVEAASRQRGGQLAPCPHCCHQWLVGVHPGGSPEWECVAYGCIRFWELACPTCHLFITVSSQHSALGNRPGELGPSLLPSLLLAPECGYFLQRTLLPRPSESQSHNVCAFSILSNSPITGEW